jgi:hypothetical protein
MSCVPRFVYVASTDPKTRTACSSIRNSRLFSKHWLLSTRLHGVTFLTSVEVLVCHQEDHDTGLKLHEFCLSVIAAELLSFPLRLIDPFYFLSTRIGGPIVRWEEVRMYLR